MSLLPGDSHQAGGSCLRAEPSEQTTLIDDGDRNRPADPGGPLESAEEALLAGSSRRCRARPTLVRLNVSSMVLAFVAFIVAMAAQMVSSFEPSYGWRSDARLAGVATAAAISFVSSLLNLSRLQRSGTQLPFILNVALDLGLACFGLALGAAILPELFYMRGYLAPAIEVLAGISAAAAVGFATVHLILAVVRGRDTYRSRYWEQPWNFLNGQMKVEFSIKFMSEPERETGQGSGNQRAIPSLS